MNYKDTHNTARSDLRSSAANFQKGLWVRWLRISTLLLLDVLSISVAWTFAVTHGTNLRSDWTAAGGLHFLPLVLTVAIGIIATRGLYNAGNQRRNYLALIQAVFVSAVLLLFIAFLYEPNHYVSRSTFLLFWLLSSFFVCVDRFGFGLATVLLRKQGIIRHSVALICDLESKERNSKMIEKQDCYNLVQVLNSSALDRANRQETLTNLRKLNVSEVFVSWGSIKNRLHICWHFQAAGITLHITHLQNEFLLPPFNLRFVDGVLCTTVSTPILTGISYWIKRLSDFLCSAVLLMLLSPIYFAIAILIKLDSPGSIFFKQTRLGLHNRKFKVWKFRTMVANAAQLQEKLEQQNEMKDGVLFKMKDDPRITRVGGLLRRYSLDELPQLLNVLVGEMSFVGPRPLPLRDVERFEERHFIRQEVLPGITGLWQVSGRSDIESFEEAVDLDLSYIANWSLELDLQILLKTVQVVLHRTGAY